MRACTFLYSQDLSNCKTTDFSAFLKALFLYSQDLSNCKTVVESYQVFHQFLYSQDLSNCKTRRSDDGWTK